MNENLNLIEILKDCPQGKKLYSTIYGDVTFESINEKKSHPIIVRIGEDHTECFSIDGRLYNFYNGECTLFPSREQRDWSKFKLKCLKSADARLYLESLWHDASEEPLLEDKEIIFLDELNFVFFCRKFGGTFSYMLEDMSWEEYMKFLRISKWAYLDDLLPKQFGNSEQLKGGEK